MTETPVSEAICYAIGGGWGNDEPDAGLVPVRVIRGADFPSVATSSLDGVPLRYEKTDKLDKRSLQVGDIILEISGGTKNRPTGRTVRVTEQLLGDSTTPLIPASFSRLVRIDSNVADPVFVYYALQHLYNEGGTWEYQNQSTGISNFQFELFRKSYSLPPLPLGQQRQAAEVLGALDDKIAANERIEQVTDELLASQFQESVAGCKWSKLVTIGDANVADVKPKAEGWLRYVDISAVGQGTVQMPELIEWRSAPSRARRGLRRGDTVWSTVRPNRRSHALILDDDPLLVASTGLAVLTPHPNRTAGLYEATRTEEFARFLESEAEGSAYPAVRGDKFLDAPVPAIPDSQWDDFERVALPMRERAHAAAVESRTLAATRDELLPLLMSGKLRVRDAEKVVEDVT